MAGASNPDHVEPVVSRPSRHRSRGSDTVSPAGSRVGGSSVTLPLSRRERTASLKAGAAPGSVSAGRASSCRSPNLGEQPLRPLVSTSIGSGKASGSGLRSLTATATPTPPTSQGVSIKHLGPGAAEILPLRAGTPFTVSAFQHIGDRKSQEDRFTVVPQLEPSNDGMPCAFFGVFDGTVGDFASESVKDLVIPKLFESPSWQALRQLPPARWGDQDSLVEGALREMYRSVDESLLERCSQSTQHYSTCTSVTLIVVGDMLAVGHLGDSRLIVGREVPGDAAVLIGEQMTVDHKPDQDSERRRIEQCGGMVERLVNHCNKPFIRGGDFTMRKALGEQPMQLQYSRAFGAKDLKIFGLSSIPDVKVLHTAGPDSIRVRFAILASDGLWDVLSAQDAVRTAQQAVSEGASPAQALVARALLDLSQRQAKSDNITAICVHFD
mmetsp:Transcript_7551/g.13937  ORF Transcript_7551/g.13937 Transcript_7551/m.13937 type:complete len:439 (+) Transcript_7551:47-1363(+)